MLFGLCPYLIWITCFCYYCNKDRCKTKLPNPQLRGQEEDFEFNDSFRQQQQQLHRQELDFRFNDSFRQQQQQLRRQELAFRFYDRLRQQQQQLRRQVLVGGQVVQIHQQHHRRQESVQGQVEHRRQQQLQSRHHRQQSHRPQPFTLNSEPLRNGLLSLAIEMDEPDFPPSYSRSVSLSGGPAMNLNGKDSPPSYYDAIELQNIVITKSASCDENQNERNPSARWLLAKKLITRRLNARKFIEMMQENCSKKYKNLC